MQCWKTLREYAEPNSARSTCAREMHFTRRHSTTRQPSLSRRAKTGRCTRPESTLGRAVRTKQAAQILDSMQREAYRQRGPFVVAGAELGGYRTIVSVPMLKDDELIGAISFYRQEV